jgi:glycosyltransferase involved in cell wall biosynthesis
MRVALVAPFGLRPKGTTGARVLPIGKVLAAQGATVRLIIPPWDDPGQAGQRWTESGVEIVHTRLGIGPLRPPTIMWDIGRELRSFQPDVVHAFKPIGYSGAVARRLASGVARGGPLVVVDADDLEGPAGWAGRHGFGIGGRLRGTQERRTLRTALYVTVASGWLADFMDSLGVAPDRVLRLPNGYDADALLKPKAEESVPDGKRIPFGGTKGMLRSAQNDGVGLLWYTRFTEAKPERAAQLLAPLLRAHPELRLTVLGDELRRGDLRAQQAAFATEGVAAQVAWVGYDEGLWSPVAGSGLVAVYLMDDDVVNRARCPSKVPQLMALGIPLVAEGVGEVRSYLAGLDRACLVEPGDDEGFRRLVESLLGSANKRARLSKRLQRAAERWHWDRVAAGLLPWYESAVNR